MNRHARRLLLSLGLLWSAGCAGVDKSRPTAPLANANNPAPSIGSELPDRASERTPEPPAVVVDDLAVPPPPATESAAALNEPSYVLKKSIKPSKSLSPGDRSAHADASLGKLPNDRGATEIPGFAPVSPLPKEARAAIEAPTTGDRVAEPSKTNPLPQDMFDKGLESGEHSSASAPLASAGSAKNLPSLSADDSNRVLNDDKRDSLDRHSTDPTSDAAAASSPKEEAVSAKKDDPSTTAKEGPKSAEDFDRELASVSSEDHVSSSGKKGIVSAPPTLSGATVSDGADAGKAAPTHGVGSETSASTTSKDVAPIASEGVASVKEDHENPRTSPPASSAAPTKSAETHPFVFDLASPSTASVVGRDEEAPTPPPALGVCEGNKPVSKDAQTKEKVVIALKPSQDELGKAAPAKNDLVAPPSLNALALDRLAFCTQVLGFGDIQPLARVGLTPGEQVLLYVEVRHFQSKDVGGKFETSLASLITFEGPDGTIVAPVEFRDVVDHCQTRRHDFYCHYTFTIPETLKPGSYRLRLTVRDHHGGQTASQTVPLVVVAGPVKGGGKP